MRIKVLGKAHLEGTSKRTGKDYNFHQVHYLGAARGVEGQAAQTLSLDPGQVSYSSIIIGEDYNVAFDNRGYPVVFELIQPKR